VEGSGNVRRIIGTVTREMNYALQVEHRHPFETHKVHTNELQTTHWKAASRTAPQQSHDELSKYAVEILT
jgi:hypothetical protein